MAGVLRGLPAALAASAPVAFALRAWVALRTADWARFLRLHARGDWAQRALMAPRLLQACSCLDPTLTLSPREYPCTHAELGSRAHGAAPAPGKPRSQA